MKQAAEPLFVGLDVGSTTVKATVLNDNNRILWKDYKRHNAHQSEVTLAFLTRIEEAFPQRSLTIFCTGNGGRAIAPLIGATQVQEVNAVTVAVERLHPHAGSVVELGGQDAKVVIWKTDLTGGKSSISFMNDKCAGGTGATLDKIFARIGISSEQAQALRLEGKTIHHVAAKCGVFAETDVVGLLKAGVPQDEIALSVCTAVVQQNIEVLLHGNVLPDDVLLLGGPHTYLPVFADIWRALLPEVWRLHGYQPANRSLESLIRVPVDAQYFAALGAVFFGRESEAATNAGRTHPTYCGTGPLRAFTEEGKHAHLEKLGNTLRGLVASDEERDQFIAQYASPPFSPPATIPGSTINVWLGIDGGSTSSKLALLSNSGELMYSDYVLSGGNPILDVCRMLENLHHFEQQRDISFHIQGAGVTGYASDLLRIAFCLDAQLVETVAHLKSAVHFHGDVDVICDVGGQDIKVLFMKHGRVVDLRLNTQCSAGNGYFLQGMANQFGVPIESYAEHAFSARKAPSFNCGCAVFMEQDKVNFQQLGWTRDEIMAGLALVLPLNIWNYVVQEANLSRFGTRFLLQGGTQKNLAAVKAQVDFIRNKVPSATVSLHRYAEVAGAIGAAIEVQETRQGIPSTFIGVQNAASVRFSTLNDESTACHFCTNNCPRTFIDICIPGHDPVRHVSGYHCEKGEFTSTAEMKSHVEAISPAPNLVQESNLAMWKQYPAARVGSDAARHSRSSIVVGIPRLLNLFYYAPFFTTYLRSLGIDRVVFSDPTSEKLWKEGNQWGAIDPCFPAKVAPAHIYNLLQKKDVTHILFPMITHLESTVTNTLGNNACVIQMGTPEVVEAAFTRNRDHFAERGITFWKPLIRMDRKSEALGNLFEYFESRLQITREESNEAAAAGYAAMAQYLEEISSKGQQVLNDLIKQNRIGLLCIGHPYHHDPGLNHGILDAFSQKGFPILSIESLPTTNDFLDPLFSTTDSQPFDITDIWQRNFNRNTNAKIWAARIASRHPNLAVIDLSSFKCGHDAPTYSYVDAIFDASETPHFLFHDIDQNRPGATFKIRIDSIVYFLQKEQLKLLQTVLDSKPLKAGEPRCQL